MTQSRRTGATRRQFIGSLGAGGLALAQPRLLRATEKTDVIVLGAGLSGLYSAMLLEELGLKVTVLEASDHVGGRVQTRNIGGHLNELGASDIGVMYARVLNMIDELGLTREPSNVMRIRPFSYHVRGQMVRAEDWESSSANQTAGDERSIAPPRLESTLISQLNPLRELDDWLSPSQRELDVPIGEYLSARGVSDEAIRLIGHTYNGNGVGVTSALNLFRDNTRTRFGMEAYGALKAAGEEVAPLSQVRGGNQRLPEAMAQQLNNPVRFGRIAATVEQDVRGVEVACLNGERYRAQFLVVAIPLLALRNISFSPALSDNKSAAAASIDYYPTTKFYLRPTAKFWEQDGFEPTMWTDGPVERVFAATEDNGDVHTLLVWINGQGARRIDQLDPEAAKARVLETLATLRPACRGKLEVMAWHSWGQTPFIGGCGHSFAAGQISRFAGRLPMPEGRVHFAGEHTRRREFGMEAAMASAERIAGEVFERA